ncbi:MAG: hypothetical protein H0T13_07345, partial [Actinobacteria bacterium]|nr:hypothetical protein [Actinomycetota bacterium]
MPARLRLPVALLLCLVVAAAIAAALWQRENTAAALLAVEGVRSAYDSG